MEKYAVIVAGGQGNRMNSSIPKQFMLLNDIPILIHVIKKIYVADKNIKIIIALPKKNNVLTLWKNLCKKYKCNIPHTIIFGGKTRFESVKNSLAQIKTNNGIVLIHDGVRPLVSQKLITSCISSVKKNIGVVPVIPLKDSIRKLKNKCSVSITRSNLFAVQTPQCFNISEIKQAYKQTTSVRFTDDATVFENAGGSIILIPGEENNIKITTKLDLKVASLL